MSARKADVQDKRLYVRLGLGLAAMVVGLAALVWWSLPGHFSNEPTDTPSATEDPEAEDPEAEDRGAAAQGRPPRASAEFAVLTDRPSDVVRRLTTATEIQKHLDARYCGPACDAVNQLMLDADAFEIDIRETDDLLLPKDALDVLAPKLTPGERDSIDRRKTAVVIRTRGPFTSEQLPARAAFAATAALAAAFDGLVYDEACRRIETATDFARRTIVAPLSEPAFGRRNIVVQLYRQEDGTARLVTLGMARFGSPDISIRGANMAAGPLLAEVVNAAASKVASGTNATALDITPSDIGRVLGKAAAELGFNASAARTVTLEIVKPERIEGDPDNEMIELVPSSSGANRDGWDIVVASLFGAPPSMSTSEGDVELAEVAKHARAELPNAIRRFQAGEGELFVKGPFPIPPESQIDGGATTELLWLSTAACDDQRCTGVLSNEPTYASNLAAGKMVSVTRTDAVDWMLRRRDGVAIGGESIKVLKARLPR